MVHNKNSLLVQHSKEIVHFNRHELGFLTQECNVKDDSIGIPKSDKKFQLLVFLAIRLTSPKNVQLNQTPQPCFLLLYNDAK